MMRWGFVVGSKALVLKLCVLQVRIGFIAGVILIILMIPLNTVIASRINSATASMMKFKARRPPLLFEFVTQQYLQDSRTLILSEALRGIKSLKMVGLEQPFFKLSSQERSQELVFLGVRKYLDAVCVFLWAATPVIVPFATFSTTALMGRHLDAAEVSYCVSCLDDLFELLMLCRFSQRYRCSIC